MLLPLLLFPPLQRHCHRQARSELMPILTFHFRCNLVMAMSCSSKNGHLGCPTISADINDLPLSSWVHGPLQRRPIIRAGIPQEIHLQESCTVNVSDLLSETWDETFSPVPSGKSSQKMSNAALSRKRLRGDPTTLSSLPRTSLRERALSHYNEVGQGTINKVSGESLHNFAIRQRRERECIHRRSCRVQSGEARGLWPWQINTSL